MAPVQGGLSAPPGVTPNFDHPDRSLQAVDYFVQAIFFSVITPIVVARLYGRAFVTRMFAAEDCEYGLSLYGLSGDSVLIWSRDMYCCLGRIEAS